MARRQPRPGPAGDASEQQVALPKVPCDPLASLPPVEIITECAGRTWTIPAINADGWLKILWSTPFDPDAIFPGLVDDDEIDDVLLDAFLDGTLEPEESSRVAMEILEVASGFSYWITLRLTSIFAAGWSRLGGMLLNQGVDMTRMSLGAWCVAALDLCVSNMEPRKAAELINELLARPPGVGEDIDPFDELEDTQAFMEAMNTVF